MACLCAALTGGQFGGALRLGELNTQADATPTWAPGIGAQQHTRSCLHIPVRLCAWSVAPHMQGQLHRAKNGVNEQVAEAVGPHCCEQCEWNHCENVSILYVHHSCNTDWLPRAVWKHRVELCSGC